MYIHIASISQIYTPPPSPIPPAAAACTCTCTVLTMQVEEGLGVKVLPLHPVLLPHLLELLLACRLVQPCVLLQLLLELLEPIAPQTVTHKHNIHVHVHVHVPTGFHLGGGHLPPLAI